MHRPGRPQCGLFAVLDALEAHSPIDAKAPRYGGSQRHTARFESRAPWVPTEARAGQAYQRTDRDQRLAQVLRREHNLHQGEAQRDHDRPAQALARGLDVGTDLTLCRATTRMLALSWYFLCLSGCSVVLVDQAPDDVGALDAGGYSGRLAGFVQWRPLFPRLVRPMFVVVPRILGQDPP